MTDRLPMMVAVAIATSVVPARARESLRREPPTWPFEFWDTLDESAREDARTTADALLARGWDAVVLGDALYPKQLAVVKSPPPVLFVWGDVDLLHRAAIGVCGSRKASEAGLRAARACAAVAAREGLVVVSGNAPGVDTEAHIGALEGGSATILVIPEGALHYRPRRSEASGDLDGRVLVLSQFPPRQRWHVGSAMARNGVVAALGEALIVVEAGNEGGTLNAGRQALAMGRPVVALQFDSMPTPPGNAILHAKGALRLQRASDLPEILAALRASDSASSQLGLALG
jgi:DNA processing protein